MLKLKADNWVQLGALGRLARQKSEKESHNMLSGRSGVWAAPSTGAR